MRDKKPKKTARVNTGRPTNELVFSAYQSSNDEVFPLILDLYVKKGAVIAETTFGKGVFWKRVDLDDYDVRFSDLKVDVPDNVQGGVDARKLPYGDEVIDAVVFDPPYMHTPGGTAHNGHQNFEGYYANNVEVPKEVLQKIWSDTGGNPPKYHEAILDLYYRAGKEALRVLKPEGIYIVKCQDEVCSNRQRLTHMEIAIELEKYGFVVEDLFVVMRKNRPGVSRLKNHQYHARKNHSYFMVFRKPKPKTKRPTRKTTTKKIPKRNRRSALPE